MDDENRNEELLPNITDRDIGQNCSFKGTVFLKLINYETEPARLNRNL